jgi:hypothetical protein
MRAGRHADSLCSQRTYLWFLVSTHAFLIESLLTHSSFGGGCRVAQAEQVSNLLFCRHRSSIAAIGVRVDLQRPLVQVLRFETDGCELNFLSPVKPLSYLRLKNIYP